MPLLAVPISGKRARRVFGSKGSPSQYRDGMRRWVTGLLIATRLTLHSGVSEFVHALQISGAGGLHTQVLALPLCGNYAFTDYRGYFGVVDGRIHDTICCYDAMLDVRCVLMISPDST